MSSGVQGSVRACRNALVGAAALGAASLVCCAALAQPAQKPAGPPNQNKGAPIVLTRDTPASAAGRAARERQRKGDCQGALDAYDQAIATSIDPELRRDRGLCHEQLGHPWPAIDDYRAYLRDRPSAPDADQIRQRLEALEEQVGVGGKASARRSDDTKSAGGGAGASASVSINGEGASASTSGASGESSEGKSGKSRNQRDFEADEKLAGAASASPLREARGWVIGPYLGIRQSADLKPSINGIIGAELKGTLKMGTNVPVGAAIRYSFGKTSTLLTEIGYVSFNDANLGGPGVFAGYEARFALSNYTSDALILGVGLGYERYRAADNGTILNNLLPRARLGYRHVFGPSIGLEIHGDGGLGYYWLNDVSNVSIPVAPVFGGYVAFVVGF